MHLANLDLDTLRALVLANDLGGYGQAAAQLGRTPSAVSLQMKRLQTDVGATLFRKDGRGIGLTEAGEIVLRYSRRMLALHDELLDTVRGAALTGRVSIGVAQDFAESVLPDALSRYLQLYPLVQVDVRIEGNAALVDAIEKGELDVALVVGHADRPTARVLGELELAWIAGPDFARRPELPLALAVLGPQCAFRKEAIRQLDGAGIPWRVAAVSPSLAGLWAAAIAGLGITARSVLGVPPRLVWDTTLFDLPRLDAFPVTLHAASHATGTANGAVERLRGLVSDAATATLAVARRPQVASS
jgi:DNA-binding transcriptional LysR family regulator